MKLRKLLYLCLALWLVFPCIAFVISTADYTLLIGTRGTAFFIQGILNCVAAFCGILLVVLHYCKTARGFKHKIVLSLTAAGIVLLMLCGNFLCRFFDGMEEYHSFRSPDGSHTVVLMENVDPISGQVILYERVNPFLLRRRGHIITNNGYRPVCAGEYALGWQGDTVTLLVADGAGENKVIAVTLTEG